MTVTTLNQSIMTSVVLLDKRPDHQVRIFIDSDLIWSAWDQIVKQDLDRDVAIDLISNLPFDISVISAAYLWDYYRDKVRIGNKHDNKPGNITSPNIYFRQDNWRL